MSKPNPKLTLTRAELLTGMTLALLDVLPWVSIKKKVQVAIYVTDQIVARASFTSDVIQMTPGQRRILAEAQERYRVLQEGYWAVTEDTQ